MEFDLRKVAQFIRRADSEELLDRVTVYREGMEPAAVDLMENELARRGYSPAEIADHDRERRATAIMQPDGTRPAVQFLRPPGGVARSRVGAAVGASADLPDEVRPVRNSHSQGKREQRVATKRHNKYGSRPIETVP